MYTGKEVCQGCKKPGTEVARWYKTDLCQSCKSIIYLGKAELVHRSMEYVGIRQHHFAFSDSVDWDTGGLINDFLRDVLTSMDNPTAEKIAYSVAIKNSQGDNTYNPTVPKAIIEPLTKFCLRMEEVIKAVRQDKDSFPRLAQLEVSKERDRIYNEGIEKGRNLLFELNAGNITMDDFAKNITYKSKDK